MDVQEGASTVLAASAKSPPVANQGGIKSNDGVIYASFAGLPATDYVRHLMLVTHATAIEIQKIILASGGFDCTQTFPFNDKTC